ncbi:PP2C family protein-serine/threonine phosphatase [Tundrisphaera sp. TA3]|uniref:PP2C family protein-serine/threonine phosphatase n=1 Tax=Tundrisphaera sp. TA3 TaxID=3435775 RepID=UPI003EB97BF0
MARRILLVDDSATMRRMIGALLLGEGYEVSAAVDGLDGLAKARELAPELILSDYEMPELDGPGFCQALKADPALRPIPVIMLTTLGASESKVVGLDAGADDYIEKPKGPGEVQEIFARIRAQLRIADLRNELAERNKELEAAKAKLDLELKLARKVQRGLMPPAPKPRGVLRMAVRYHPANELGGDVYDIIRLEGNRLGVLVADISGHGVNSALLSGVVKAIATPLISAGLGPGPVLAGLDAGVEQFFPEGFFCTAFYAIVDEATGEITYGGVGHPPGLIVGPNGSRQLESDNGLIGVGMVEGLEGGTDRLAVGESLLIYTDGLPDAMDLKDVPFNTERILDVLGRSASLGPGEILDRVEQSIADHVDPGHPHDDINLVLIQYPGD